MVLGLTLDVPCVITMHFRVEGRLLYPLHPLTRPKFTGCSSGPRRIVTLEQSLYLSELLFLQQGQLYQP